MEFSRLLYLKYWTDFDGVKNPWIFILDGFQCLISHLVIFVTGSMKNKYCSDSPHFQFSVRGDFEAPPTRSGQSWNSGFLCNHVGIMSTQKVYIFIKFRSARSENQNKDFQSHKVFVRTHLILRYLEKKTFQLSISHLNLCQLSI